MAVNEARIVLTAEDKTAGAFNSVKNNLSSLGTQAKDAVSGVGALGAAFSVLGGVAAGALSVTALRGAVDLLDQIDDLSEKTGIAAESLSALRYAGEVVGTPLEALATGVRKLSVNMAAAAAGGKEQAAAFATIGVSFKNLDGSLRSSDQVLGALADKFATLRDGPEKAALAIELFGKSGADMIPLLNKGSAGIADLRLEAERLGVVFSGDLAANAAEFNDNLKKIQIAGQAFATTVTGELLPSLIEMQRLFLDSKDGSNSLAQSLGVGLKTGLEAVVVLASDVSFVLNGIGREIGAIAAQTAALARLDVDGFNAISKAVKEDAARARKDLDDFQARILGIGNTFKDPRILGSVGTIKQQAQELLGTAPIIKKIGDTAKESADSLQKLLDKINGKATGFDPDYEKNINLLRAALDSGRLSWDEYTQAVQRYVAMQPAAVEAAKALTKEIEAAQKVAEERQALRLKEDAGIAEWLRAQEAASAQQLKAINERIDGLALEEEATALAAAQNTSLAAAIETVTIARLREKQTLLEVGSTAYEQVQAEIDARQRLLGVINTKDAREKETAGWAQVFASIDSTAHDTWVNVWESGSSAFKRLGQTLKASILDALYQIALRPIIVKIGASVLGTGFASAANAATGNAGSVLSGAGNLAGFVSGGTSFANMAGSAFANLTGTGIDGLLATNAAFGTAAAEGMGSIMAGLTAAAPYLAGVAAVYAIAKALDKSGTPHTGAGSFYSAATGTQQASAGAVFNSGFTGINYSASTEQFTTGLVQSIVGILDATATTFGKEAGHQAAASFADDSSKDGAWGSLFIRNLQGVITDWQAGGQSFRTFSDGSAGSAEYLAAISADVRKALDGIGIPAWATKMLNDLGAAPTLEQLAGAVQQITATQNALVQMRTTLQGFAQVGDDAALRLITASGGVDKLAASVGGYYQAMYSEEEKAAAIKRQYTAALESVNQTVPTSIKAYREQVEYLQSIVNTEPAAAAALAVMYEVAPAFASVNQVVQDLAPTVIDTAQEIATLEQTLAALRNPARTIEEIAQSIVSLESSGASLRADLLAAQGDTAGAQALRRALDTAGFTAAELALYDYNQVLRDQITAANAAAEAATAARNQEIAAAQAAEAASLQAAEAAQRAAEAQAAAVAQQRAGLQEQYDLLIGVTTQRAVERSKLDESNRALFDQIQALEDQAAASEAAARAAKDQASAQADLERAIAQERAGLQDQLDQLTLTSSELLARQRAALDESNRALFDQVQAATAAAEEMQRVADAAAAAAQKIAGEHDNLWRQWLTETGDTAALRQLELAALDPVNRALQEQIWALKDQKAATDDQAESSRAAAAAAAAAAQKIASEHDTLWRQWLTATGDTAALRALELDALDPSNRALQQQIWALEDQKKAADEAASAAQQLASTWSGLSDGLMSEVERIRGLITEGSGSSYPDLQARFAIATAQARALDQEAAKLLPSLSQSLLAAYGKSATSLTDLQRMQALTANSLETTANLIGAATGAPSAATAAALPGGGAMIAVPITAAPTAPTQNYSLADMVVELRREIAALKTEMAALRADSTTQQETIAINTGKTARLLDKFDVDGMPAVRA